MWPNRKSTYPTGTWISGQYILYIQHGLARKEFNNTQTDSGIGMHSNPVLRLSCLLRASRWDLLEEVRCGVDASVQATSMPPSLCKQATLIHSGVNVPNEVLPVVDMGARDSLYSAQAVAMLLCCCSVIGPKPVLLCVIFPCLILSLVMPYAHPVHVRPAPQALATLPRTTPMLLAGLQLRRVALQAFVFITGGL